MRVLMLSLPLTLVSMYWTHRLGLFHPYGYRFSLADFLRRDWRWEWAFGQLKQRLLFTTVLASVPVVSVSLSLDRKQNNRVRAAAAVALGRLQSVESVGALTTALYDHSAAVRRAAVPALKSALPLLTPEHYGQLGVQAIPNLCRALGHGDELLVLHVLDALEKVGDGRAVQPVEETATRGRTDRIRQMAIRILPLLQERQRQESASKMLLRAAVPTESAPHTLLRPVSAEPLSPLQTSMETPLPTTGASSPVTTQPDEQPPQVLRLNTSG
jgi:hypothetical protein